MSAVHELAPTRPAQPAEPDPARHAWVVHGIASLFALAALGCWFLESQDAAAAGIILMIAAVVHVLWSGVLGIRALAGGSRHAHGLVWLCGTEMALLGFLWNAAFAMLLVLQAIMLAQWLIHIEREGTGRGAAVFALAALLLVVLLFCVFAAVR